MPMRILIYLSFYSANYILLRIFDSSFGTNERLIFGVFQNPPM